MAYNTTASLDTLTCSNYGDFGICQDRFGDFSRSKRDSNYSNLKLRVFKKDDNKDSRLAQNHTIAEADLNQFMQMRYQMFIAVENIGREQNLSPVLIPAMSRDNDEQLNWLTRWLKLRINLCHSAVVQSG